MIASSWKFGSIRPMKFGIFCVSGLLLAAVISSAETLATELATERASLDQL